MYEVKELEKIPENIYQPLLEQVLERGYLNNTDRKNFLLDKKEIKTIRWLQITRLPIHPNENEGYDLLSRWQGALSSLHAWGHRFIFLLLRNNGETKLFLGTTSAEAGITTEEAIEQVREASFGAMPGIGLKTLDVRKQEVWNDIVKPLQQMNSIGAVTGIPSFKDSKQQGMLQTLDSLAFGLRDANGFDKNYALMVIADPIHDRDVADIINRHRQLSGTIHTGVKRTVIEKPGSTKTSEAKVTSLLSVVGTIASTYFCGEPFVGGMIGRSLGNILGGGNISRGLEPQETAEYLDKFAQYAEEALDYHIERLNQGRNFGFWNTGVYVLGEMQRDVTTVTGMLRSIYSGEKTYYEPIRLHKFSSYSNALEIVRDRFELLPMIYVSDHDKTAKNNSKEWHMFGENYQYLSTPMTTKELSLATSLPRRDVPGLRFVKTAVRFANNPAEVDGDTISIGNIVDTGVVQNNLYKINPDSLVTHALVAGTTGIGKSTTCKQIAREIIKRDIPIMVIEPAKEDYVRWAIEMNKHLPEEKKFKIYMPDLEEFEGVKLEKLAINPFEPAAVKGAKVDLLQHCETFTTLLNACLPAQEIVPILIEEAVYETIRDVAQRRNRDLEAGMVEPLDSYPLIDDIEMMAVNIMKKKQYFRETKDNLTEILNTRFEHLGRGSRGKILNVFKSVDYDELFSGNVIINLSEFGDGKDKALIMSLLLNALYEYRRSRYRNDREYRKEAQQNKLKHLLLIEEAHNVLKKPEAHLSSGDPQRAAADLFSIILSEIREYGQGLMIVDQIPSRLIDDAIKNTNYKIVHRLTSGDEKELMASCMALRDEQKYMIPALGKGNIIICGEEDDAAAWVKVPAPQQ